MPNSAATLEKVSSSPQLVTQGSGKSQIGPSLHGDSAVRRQAITELLFFASIGDKYRCQKIINTWHIQPQSEDCCDYDKRTPLHLAASRGSHTIAKWLIETCKANVNSIDQFGRTPLEEAARGDHGEVVTLLVHHGGKVLNDDKELVDLSESALAGSSRLFGTVSPQWEVDRAAITLEEKIGEGEFGVVYRARWHGTLVAVKVLKHTTPVALGDFRTELNVLMKVHHPHTVQFMGAVTKGTPYMIIAEYMQGGSLADLFAGQITFTMKRAVRIALETARGIAYLHNRKPQAVIHRDLKPANLMIGGFRVRGEQDHECMVKRLGVVKITDFGLSRSLKTQRTTSGSGSLYTTSYISGKSGSAFDVDSSTSGSKGDTTDQLPPRYKLTGETGSYRYMAPEVYRHELYNEKVDVYAFAMIAYQLFQGIPPFYNKKPTEAAKAAAFFEERPAWSGVGRGNERIPAELIELVERCWAADADQRPDFMEIEHILHTVYEKMPDHSLGGSCCSLQ